MNLRKLIRTSVFFITISAVSFSCKKDSSSTTGNNSSDDIEIAQENTLSESTFNDVTTMVDQAGLTGSVSILPSSVETGQSAQNTSTLLSACASLTIDTVNSPRTITIDFGSTNCLCKDARNRRGKVIASFTGRYRDEGTVIGVTFDGYYVNDNKVEGTKTVTNLGLNNAGNLVYSIVVNGRIIRPNVIDTLNWSSTRQREWVAGANTPTDLSDDTYSITGSANGTTIAKTTYSITIDQPLVRKMSCSWFESGVLTLIPQGKVARTLDYGNTGCDANATLTVLGVSFPIVLQ